MCLYKEFFNIWYRESRQLQIGRKYGFLLSKIVKDFGFRCFFVYYEYRFQEFFCGNIYRINDSGVYRIFGVLDIFSVIVKSYQYQKFVFQGKCDYFMFILKLRENIFVRYFFNIRKLLGVDNYFLQRKVL